MLSEQQWCIGKTLKQMQGRFKDDYDKRDNRVWIGRNWYQIYMKYNVVSCIKKL